jgi:hypothetical protein
MFSLVLLVGVVEPTRLAPKLHENGHSREAPRHGVAGRCLDAEMTRLPARSVLRSRTSAILLYREDFNGIPMIKQAMELNSDFVPVGCALIQVFFGSTIAKTMPRHRRAKEHERIVALAALERRRIHRRDRFIETGLDDATIAPIREELSKCPEWPGTS